MVTEEIFMVIVKEYIIIWKNGRMKEREVLCIEVLDECMTERMHGWMRELNAWAGEWTNWNMEWNGMKWHGMKVNETETDEIELN